MNCLSPGLVSLEPCCTESPVGYRPVCRLPLLAVTELASSNFSLSRPNRVLLILNSSRRTSLVAGVRFLNTDNYGVQEIMHSNNGFLSEDTIVLSSSYFIFREYSNIEHSYI